MNLRHTDRPRALRAALALAVTLSTLAGPTLDGQVRSRPLAPGARAEATLGNESAWYVVRVRSGEVSRVTVERPASVIVLVTAPSGSVVAERARVEPLDRPEQVTWIAEESGDYRVELRPRDTGQPAGSYAVRLDFRRPAVGDDASAVAAERAFDEGERLRRRGEASASRQAIAEYSKALTAWQAVVDRRGEADALLAIGLAHRSLSENNDALEFYQRSLEPRRAAGDHWGEAFTLQNIALVYRSRGELEPARDHYEQALALGRANGDERAVAEALNGLARVAFDLADYQTTLRLAQQVLPVTRALGDRRGEAYTLNTIGTVYWEWGETRRAVDAFGQALALRRAIGDRLGEANTVANIAAVYTEDGQPREALGYLDTSLALARTLGNRRAEAESERGRAQAFHQLGELQAARASYEAAIRLAQAASDRPQENDALAGLAEVESALGATDLGRTDIARALAMTRQSGDSSAEAAVLLRQANIERAHGEFADALASNGQALDLIEDLRRRIPNLNLRATYLASTRQAFETRIDLLMHLAALDPSGPRAADAFEASERARARSLLDTLVEARENIREGVAPDLIARECEIQARLRMTAARLATLTQGQGATQVRGALERTLDELIAESNGLDADIRRQSPRYAALTQPRPLTAREVQQQVVDADTVLLEYVLGEERSFVWVVTPHSFTSHVLPGRATITDAALAVHAALQDGHRPGRGAAARAAAEALSRMVLGPVAGQLGDRRLLIVPDGALQFVPFAALPHPSDAVGETATGTAAADLLVVRHEIIMLPSASIVPVLRSMSAGRPAADRAAVILADPVMDRSDPRLTPARVARTRPAQLPAAVDAEGASALTRASDSFGEPRFPRLRFTRTEAQAIAALTGRDASLVALDFDASRATALRPDLARYRFVHFATHALLNARHPELSGIVLSLVGRDGRAEDGFLRLGDIYNLRLGAELVVLSACQTALGRDVRGEGLIGLTRGFMYAGAPRVVASLWDVRDEQTSEFMTRFYRGMMQGGLRPAAALRAAQVSMLRDPAWSAPAYWAGFVLQGEWQ